VIARARTPPDYHGRMSETGTDDYTAEHMAGGNVILRDKRVAGTALKVLSLVPAALFLAGGIGSGAAALLAEGRAVTSLAIMGVLGTVLGAMFALMWLMGNVLRTVVTDRELHIQYALLGPRIPIERIKSCRVAEQRNRVRVGKRFEDGMWTSSYLLGLGEYVEVIFENERGGERRVVFTPEDPRGVARAINKARDQRAGKLRIDGEEVASEEMAAEEMAADEMAADEMAADETGTAEELEAGERRRR
jgi:hypothetical protein